MTTINTMGETNEDRTMGETNEDRTMGETNEDRTMGETNEDRVELHGPRAGISLITTVRNEEHSIDAFLNSIARQSVLPDEVIVVDGGSTDGTMERIRAFRALPIRYYQDTCNIARGRNLAIRSATNEIIAVTDAGCVLSPEWLERITAFHDNIDVIAGNYRPFVRSVFDACQYSLIGLFQRQDDVRNVGVSSRSLAFRKRVWDEIGGYPEWLNYSEDAWFHCQFLNGPYRVKFETQAIVEWQQRDTLWQVFKQFFRYMEGEAIAGMHRGRNLLRFAVYTSGLALLYLGASVPAFWALLGLGFLTYASWPLRRFHRMRQYSLLVLPLLYIPSLLVFTDAAKMAGYISGLLKRRAAHAS